VRRPSRPDRPLRLAAAALAAMCLTGCITPARNDPQYRAKALAAVEAAGSEVATARLTVTQRLDHRITRPYADEVVTANETALDAIDGAFGTVQPPTPASDGTRDAVGEVLSTAGDAVAQARIAVRRDDPADLADALAELRSAAGDLADAEESLR
jgi:hypothetical protein